MPLAGSSHSSHSLYYDATPFFRTLAELDQYVSQGPHEQLEGVVPFQPRTKTVDGVDTEGKGRLLVCHDYKGGYTESPTALAYTFNFWWACHSFVYFSHHRVTIPPPGWVTAAHRQGALMLGTLIFEGSGEDDVLRLLVGALPPNTKTGPAAPTPGGTTARTSLPVSLHYARLLADLARERGFDGYLLNFECPLKGGPEQTRALAAWIGLLERELKEKVGSHAEVSWYDSILFTGHLRWQDRLNNYNLPFFLPSNTFFTNYTWPAYYPTATAQYFLSIDQSTTAPTTYPKTLQDIYVGVDVWGRGSHGGGGFGSYQALSHIEPPSLGLSVALFGPAWSWESEQDKPAFNWDYWWAYERKLWVGPEDSSEIVGVPASPDPSCAELHGTFKPLVGFFSRLPPPNPAFRAFHTSFSPGVGRGWWVNGMKVMQTPQGWTDVDKQNSLGDLLWPRPAVVWEDGTREYDPFRVSAAIDTEEAWMGGSSLQLSFSDHGQQADDAFFRCVWLPVQSLALTPKLTYEATIVFKIPGLTYDVELGLSIKSLSSVVLQTVEVSCVQASQDLGRGWTKTAIQFTLESDYTGDVLAALGLVVGVASADPTHPTKFAFHVGSISVAPLASENATPSNLQVLWGDYKPTPSSAAASKTDKRTGILTWEVAASLLPLPTTPITIPQPDDPTPVWVLDHPSRWLNAFQYFNIYVVGRELNRGVPPPEQGAFVGTTGLSGRRNLFAVERQVLPDKVKDASLVRFYIQGVTEKGEVLPWDRCAFVDVEF